MKKYRIVCLYILLLLIIPINTTTATSNNHSQIHIIGNDDFTPENGVTGGSGTENDPYIIENFSIDGTGLLGSGIFIEDTTAYFVIRNCSITNFYSPSEYCYGIRFINVENGRIEYSTTNENHKGIHFKESKSIIVSNVISSGISENSAWGIGLWLSEDITIEYSEIYDKADGIHISDCLNVTLKHSSIHDNSHYGFFCSGESETKRIHVENCSIYNNAYKGIWMMDDTFHPSYSIIKNCDIYNNGWVFQGDGILIQRLSYNIIENCSIHDNVGGINIDSSNNVIRNCSIYNHTGSTDIINTGITVSGWILYLELSWDNSIINCDIYNNVVGITLVSTFRIRIEKNNIYNNSFYGLDFWRFTYGTVTHNNFVNNGADHPEYITMCVASQQSFIDYRNNWWNDADGPDKYLALGWPYAIVKIPIRRTDGESIVFWKSIALTRPWLTEPVPDAGRQT